MKMTKKKLEELKDSIEYVLGEWGYYCYWDWGKYEFKRFVYEIKEEGEAYDFILDLYTANMNTRQTLRTEEQFKCIEPDWFVNIFKKVCIDPISSVHKEKNQKSSEI